MYASQKLRPSTFVIAIAAISFVAPAHSQSGSAPPQSSRVKTFVYDVASVKPHRPGDRTMSFGSTPVGYHGVNVTVSMLIQYAYDITMPDQISGLPGWAAGSPFDIETKMDEETLAEFRNLPLDQQWEQRRLMLQTVLADRFKLKSHREIKEQPVLELIIAKGGCKFKESTPGQSGRMMTGRGQITLQAMPVVNLANNLTNETGRIVVDKTGLTGNYDLTLKWTPEEQSTADDSAPSVYTALDEQLGLKLVPGKGPVDIVVIDHIERPTEN
jgi:uncharacterized protein (TIGR03435 family)